VTGAGGRN